MYCPLDGCHCYQWPLYHGPNDNCNDSCCYWLVVVVEDDVVVVVCCCQHRIYIDMWHKISLFIVRSRWPSNPRCVVDWLFSGLSVKRIMEMVLVLVLVLVLVSVLDVCCAADDGDDDDDAYDGIGASRAGSCSSSRSCSSSSNNRAECLLVFLQRRRTRHSSFIAAFGHNEIVSRTRTKKQQ